MSSLYTTTIVKDTERKIKLLETRLDLVTAAYPILSERPLRVKRLTRGILHSAQLEQVLEIFTSQGWVKITLLKPPYPFLQLELLPDTDQKQALTALRFTLGNNTSGLWAYPMEDKKINMINISGRTTTILNRLGLFQGSLCWWELGAVLAPENKPITVELIQRLKQEIDLEIFRDLGQPRAALDLILSN